MVRESILKWQHKYAIPIALGEDPSSSSKHIVQYTMPVWIIQYLRMLDHSYPAIKQTPYEVSKGIGTANDQLLHVTTITSIHSILFNIIRSCSKRCEFINLLHHTSGIELRRRKEGFICLSLTLFPSNNSYSCRE